MGLLDVICPKMLCFASEGDGVNEGDARSNRDGIVVAGAADMANMVDRLV